MTSSTSLLHSPQARNVTSALIAGAATYLRPARIPSWVRRGMLAANTAGTGAAVLLGTGTPTGPTGEPAPLAGRLGAKASPIGGAATALASVSGGLGLVTSGLGLRADAKAEQYLLNRGIRHPRLVMAVGVVGIVYVVSLLQERATKAAEQKAGEAADQ